MVNGRHIKRPRGGFSQLDFVWLELGGHALLNLRGEKNPSRNLPVDFHQAESTFFLIPFSSSNGDTVGFLSLSHRHDEETKEWVLTSLSPSLPDGPDM